MVRQGGYGGGGFIGTLGYPLCFSARNLLNKSLQTATYG
jgi:hypothetical protein